MNTITAKTPWIDNLGDIPSSLEYFEGTMFEAVAISAKDVSVYEEIAITNDSYKTGSIDNVSFIYWSYENSGRVEHNYVVNLIDSESSFLVTSDVDSELIQPLFSLLELIEK